MHKNLFHTQNELQLKPFHQTWYCWWVRIKDTLDTDGQPWPHPKLVIWNACYVCFVEKAFFYLCIYNAQKCYVPSIFLFTLRQFVGMSNAFLRHVTGFPGSAGTRETASGRSASFVTLQDTIYGVRKLLALWLFSWNEVTLKSTISDITGGPFLNHCTCYNTSILQQLPDNTVFKTELFFSML